MKTDSFERALESCRPWVAARSAVFEQLEPSPMGIELLPGDVYDPWRLDSGPFLALAHTLHNLVCGPFGAPMARWIGYDCGLVPGAWFGLGVPAGELPAAIRAGLGVPDDYDGLSPCSVGVAVPFPDRRSWEVISLGSINQVAPGAGPAGLSRLTLALGSALLRDDELWSVLRWRSPLIGVFSGLGPLEVVTAWTVAHDHPTTVTFKVAPSAAGRERLLRGAGVDPDTVTTWLDADDTDAMQDLQADVEAGVGVRILGGGEDRGLQLRLPLLVEGRPHGSAGSEGLVEEEGHAHHE